MFAAMNWVSAVGYAAFPLSEGGNAGALQDVMHFYAVMRPSCCFRWFLGTYYGGYRDTRYRSLAIRATAALALITIGAIGTNAAPKEYFGIFERFSVFAATGFNAVLGIYLFNGFKPDKNYVVAAKGIN